MSGTTTLFKDKVLAVVIFCSLSAYISLYLILGLFAHPSTDDYCFANKIIAEGFLQSQVSWYTGWTGRYTSTALISSYLTILKLIEYFWVVPVLLLLGSLTSFCLLFICLPRFEAICAGLLMTALYLSGVPSTSEVFYWLAGGFTYQVGNCLYLLLVVALVKLHQGNGETGKRAFWVAAPLVVIIAGLNETIMLLQILTLMLALLTALGMESRQRYLILGLLILSLVGAAVVIVAPGNAVRSASFPLAHDFLFSLKSSVLLAGLTFLSWSTSAPLWLATLIWLNFSSATVRASHAAPLQIRCIVPAAFVWLSLLVTVNFPAFWSMGAAPPARALSTNYMIFIVGWFTMVTLIAASMPLRKGIFSVGLLRAFIVLLGGALFVTGNGATALRDLGIAPSFSKQLNKRYSLIAGTSRARPSDLAVPALQDHPETIAITSGDITADKNDWKNKNYAEYFHLKSIATSN